MHKRKLNPRALFGLSLIAPHAFAFNDDPDDEPGSGPTGDPKPEPKTFTEDEVNAIVQRRLERDRANNDVEARLRSLGFNSLDEAAEAKKKLDQLEEERLRKKEDYEGLLKRVREQHQQEVNSLQEQLNRYQTEATRNRVESSLLKAAGKARSPEQVARLLRDQVRLDEETGQVIVVDERGQRRLTDGGHDFTVNQLVEEFYEKYPHHVPSAPGNGAGTKPTNGGPRPTPGQGFDPSKAMDLDHLRENRSDIIEKMKKGDINPFGNENPKK